MASLWVAKNPEIGMFTHAYIQIESVCYLEEQADGTREQNKYRREGTTEQIQMGPENKDKDMQISWEDRHVSGWLQAPKSSFQL